MVTINEKPDVNYLDCELVLTPLDIKAANLEEIRRFCAWKRFTKVHIPKHLKDVFYSSGIHDAIMPCTHRGAVQYTEYLYYKNYN